MWSTEYFARTLTGGGPTEGALYTEPVVQVAKRWYAGARFDLTGVPAGANVPRRYGVAGSLTFAPTEFSRFRLYSQELWGPSVPGALVGFLQFELSIALFIALWPTATLRAPLSRLVRAQTPRAVFDVAVAAEARASVPMAVFQKPEVKDINTS